MGNRSRRELEGAAMLRATLAHPPREIELPRCGICGEPAVACASTIARGNFYFCEAHRAEADAIFEKISSRSEEPLTAG